MDYPVDVQKFQDTLCSIRGVTSIESGLCDLEEVNTELLSTAEYAHLPHGALLRTKGGFENELLVQFRFTIEPAVQGLEALEFISWFIRDCARGGLMVQLSPFALPPESPAGRQLGQTLRFHIDLFAQGIQDQLELVYEVLQRMTKNLKLAISLYQIQQKMQ